MQLVLCFGFLGGNSELQDLGKMLQDMFVELWDMLIKSARDPDAGEIVCVLDDFRRL